MGQVLCSECASVQAQKRPRFACGHVANTSYIRGFLFSSTIIWHVSIRTSLQLVMIQVLVGYLMAMKAGRKPAVGKTRCLVKSVLWSYLFLKLMWFRKHCYFCYFTSIFSLSLLSPYLLGEKGFGVSLNLNTTLFCALQTRWFHTFPKEYFREMRKQCTRPEFELG